MKKVKNCISFFFHVLTRLFCVFPIDSKKIIFEAYMGTKYACNPKYICEYIDNIDHDYTFIWVYHEKMLDCKYRQIKRNSLSYFYHMLTAGIVIINSGNNRLLKLREKQILINTWHGGGAYKKLPNYSHKDYRKNDFFLSSCEKQSELAIRKELGFYGEIIKSGLPRNDILINNDIQKAKSIREKLNIGDRKCVLYAPTWRNDRSICEFALDYEKLILSLENKFGGEWVVLHRSHYNMFDHAFNNNSASVVDVTQYPEMQELLLISDVLITDYSSCIWDYSFLKRPVFLYATDLQNYNAERSFHVDIHEWPFPLCENNDELSRAILDFDQKTLEDAILQHQKFLGSYERGNATEQVYLFIKERSKLIFG